MNWRELLTKSAEYSYTVTDNLMALVDDADLDWKPATGANWMTTGQLLHHLTGSCGLCWKGFVTGDWGMPEGVSYEDIPADEMLPPAENLPTVSSVADARRALAADRDVARAVLAGASDERLDQEMLAAPWHPEETKRLGEHLLGMVTHLDCHKAQLFYYLKLQGKDVNTMHLWGV